jgi:U3 small nucleolar RNA-associated protein MPP10
MDKMEEFVKQAENQEEEDEELQEMLYGKKMGDDNDFSNHKYKDFFDEKDFSEEDEFKGIKESMALEEMPFHRLNEGDDEEEEEEEEQEISDEKKIEKIVNELKKEEDFDSEELAQLDPHYARRKALKDQIKQLEEENLSKKEWALQGEVSSKARPLDSLIDKNIEFDTALRPVPIITKEFTSNLEDIIKKRIMEEAWDDVVRKKVIDIPYKPEIHLNKEKSDKGLAEIYEKQYKDKIAEVTGKPASIVEELEEAGTEKLNSFKKVRFLFFFLKNDNFNQVKMMFCEDEKPTNLLLITFFCC